MIRVQTGVEAVVLMVQTMDMHHEYSIVLSLFLRLVRGYGNWSKSKSESEGKSKSEEPVFTFIVAALATKDCCLSLFLQLLALCSLTTQGCQIPGQGFQGSDSRAGTVKSV